MTFSVLFWKFLEQSNPNCEYDPLNVVRHIYTRLNFTGYVFDDSIRHSLYVWPHHFLIKTTQYLLAGLICILAKQRREIARKETNLNFFWRVSIGTALKSTQLTHSLHFACVTESVCWVGWQFVEKRFLTFLFIRLRILYSQ